MHAFLARLYHLPYAARALQLAMSPKWWPPLAAFLVAAVVRVAWPAQAAAGAGVAVVAGWFLLGYPSALFSFASPVGRLPAAALLLLAATLVPRFLPLPVLAAILAWVLRGLPLTGDGLALCVPVWLGLMAALALTRRQQPDLPAVIAASAALTASFFLGRAAIHWSWAAAIPALAGLPLLGLPAAPVLAQAVVTVTAAAIIASDRGRFIPVDAAALTPFLVWWGAPRVQKLIAGRAAALIGLVLAAALAAASAYYAGRLLGAR
jgi:hypothetical protein